MIIIKLILTLCFALFNQKTHSQSTDNVPGKMSISNNIRITAWNSRGLRAAQAYLTKLCSQTDILVLSEHNLYESQLYRLNEINMQFASCGKSSDHLNPNLQGYVPANGGIAILWRKSLSSMVKPLPHLGTDRICVIQLFTDNGGSLFVVGVYLPQSGCRVADYQEHLDVLEHIIEQNGPSGDVVVLGDFNAHFGEGLSEGGVRPAQTGKSF